MLAADLRVMSGSHSGDVISLLRKKFLIGREQDCHLRPNSEMVSRHHCAFSVDDFSVRIRDLGSTNGTLVNGQRIRSEVVLEDGDRIVIGNLDFVIEISGKQRPAEDSVVGTATAVLGVQETQANDPIPVAPSQPVTQQIPPQPSASDTVMIPVQGMMPPGQPFPPQMMPQMGYPGMPGFNAPMMPGYGQMFPGMMYPQFGTAMPGVPMAMPETAAAGGQASGGKPQLDVSLPDPSETGAVETSPAAKGSTGSDRSDTSKPTGAADDIIRQYMGRRPPGG